MPFCDYVIVTTWIASVLDRIAIETRDQRTIRFMTTETTWPPYLEGEQRRTPMALTEAQLDEFHDRGLVVVEDVLTDADLDPVIETMAEFVDRQARDLHAKGKITDLHEDEPFLTRYARLFAQSAEIGRGMDIYDLRAKPVFDFLRNDNLLDAVESFVGSEITCSPIQHLRAKPPSRLDGSPSYNVPWHQDSGVSWAESDRTLALTCWLPLVDATVERGCLEVIPDVIHSGHLDHVSDAGTRIKPDLMPETEAEPAEVRKGGVVFLSQYTPSPVHAEPDRMGRALEPGPAVRGLRRADGPALLSLISACGADRIRSAY